MKYKVQKEIRINSRRERQRLNELIEERMNKINSMHESGLDKINIEFHVDKVDGDFRLTAIIKTGKDVLVLQEKNNRPAEGILPLLDKIEIHLNKTIHAEHRDKQQAGQRRQSRVFSENIPQLKKLKNEGSKEIFNSLLKILLTQMPRYIRRRLKAAHAANFIRTNEIRLQELIDELYLLIYDHAEEIPTNEKESRVWLYRKADEFLDLKLKEAEKEKESMSRLDNFVEKELEEMDESFSIDAEYEIIPAEELDEPAGHEPTYWANDILIADDEESILSDIMLSFNRDQINAVIESEIHNLPVLKRTVMDLYLIEQLSVEDIAAVKKLTKTEVEGIIREVTLSLKKKLIAMLERI